MLAAIDLNQLAKFEDRGPCCTLLVYVDDATGRFMELLFAKSESAFSYFEATASYIKHHGKSVAFYSDKHTIFRINRKGIPDRRATPRVSPSPACSGPPTLPSLRSAAAPALASPALSPDSPLGRPPSEKPSAIAVIG